MNKLYSQSMCSVSQWRAYQAAEAMVSAEVDEVRAEADDIEPGWSQVRMERNLSSSNMIGWRQIQCRILPPLSLVFLYSTFGDKRCSITTC
jgi:hypothetical protein